MARYESIFKLQGTFGDNTFVKSIAYGDHTRARRGTYKKATLNKAMKEGSINLQEANVPAKIFKDAIAPHRDTLIDGTLWNRMLSLFRSQLKKKGAVDLAGMIGLEIDSRHALRDVFQGRADTKIDSKRSLLRIDLQYTEPPMFKAQYIDGYKFTLTCIFPDLKKKTAKTETISSNIIHLASIENTFHAELAIPPRAQTFVLCLKIEGCEKGSVLTTAVTKAMCVVASGKL